METRRFGLIKAILPVFTVILISACSNPFLHIVPPEPPNGLHVIDATTSSITIGWNMTSNTDGYKIYRSPSVFGFYAEVGLSNINAFINSDLPPNTPYFYKVAGYNHAGTGFQSFPLFARSKPFGNEPAPGAPTVTAARNPDSPASSIIITWEAATGARGYILYRITENGEEVIDCYVSGSNTYSYTDNNLSPGTKYNYKVIAYNDSKDSVTEADAITLLGAPTLKVDSTTYNSITISWNSVTNADGYYVYSRPVLGGDYELVCETESTSFTHTGLTEDTGYYYYVIAYNALTLDNNIDNLQSSILTAMTKGPPPLPPESLTASNPTSSSIYLEWSASAKAEGYKVFRSESPDGPYTIDTTYPIYSTSYTSYGLMGGTTYYYKVKAYNGNGEREEYSPVASATTTLDAPTLRVDSTTSNSVTISWTSVPGAGGYYVYRSTDGGSTFTDVTTSSTSYTHTGLASEKTYYYKVYAYNNNNVISPPSEVVPATTKGLPPAAPANVSAVKNSSSPTNSIIISWDTVGNATGYKLYYSTDGGSTFTEVTIPSTSYTHNGLSPNTTYYYKVAAYNVNGTGSPSSVVSAKTDNVPPPTTPANVSAVATSSSSITVSWNSVTGATGYKVYRSNSESGPFTEVATSLTSYQHSGLTSGTTYYYKVIAYNGGGESSPSGVVSATTPPGKPTASAAASENNITVSWTPVSGADGYYVYYSASSSGPFTTQVTGSPATSATTSINLTGLSYGTTYYYQVVAYKGSVKGDLSNVASATTKPNVAPTVTVTGTTSSSATLSWNSIAGATGYKVYRLSSGGTYELVGISASTTYIDSGLSPSTTYYYKVAAYNNAGDGPQSSSVSATTQPPPVTPKPTALSATANATSSSSITVSWSGGSGATEYYVYRSTTENGTYTQIGGSQTASPYIDTGLSANTTYYYKVVAHNNGGDTESNVTSATTKINAPTNVKPNYPASDSNTITISWDSVSGATGYDVYRSTTESGTYTKVDSSTSTSYTNTGLSDGTTYYYKVVAKNSSGSESAQSSPAASAITKPSTPTGLKAVTNAAANSITLTWDSVTGATEYRLYRSTPGSNDFQLIATTSSPFTNNNIVAGQTYYYKVAAYNSAGESVQSVYVISGYGPTP